MTFSETVDIHINAHIRKLQKEINRIEGNEVLKERLEGRLRRTKLRVDLTLQKKEDKERIFHKFPQLMNEQITSVIVRRMKLKTKRKHRIVVISTADSVYGFIPERCKIVYIMPNKNYRAKETQQFDYNQTGDDAAL